MPLKTRLIPYPQPTVFVRSDVDAHTVPRKTARPSRKGCTGHHFLWDENIARLQAPKNRKLVQHTKRQSLPLTEYLLNYPLLTRVIPPCLSLRYLTGVEEHTSEASEIVAEFGSLLKAYEEKLFGFCVLPIEYRRSVRLAYHQRFPC